MAESYSIVPVSNKIVHWLLQGLVKKEVDLSALEQQFKVDFSRLPLTGSAMDSTQFAHLMRVAFELLNDESAGHSDKPLRLGTFRMMCHATIGCGNLRQALIRMKDFFALLSDELQWRLSEQGEEATLSFFHHSINPAINGYFSTCMLTIIWRWAAWMVDSPLLLNRVSFNFDTQDYQPELKAIFNASIFENRNECRLVLPSNYLNLPIKQNSQTLSKFLQNSPECLLSHYHPASSTSNQVKQALESFESLDHASLAAVAEQLNCSAQTLARRLRSEGHQFQELKDKIRKNQAVELLISSKHSISEISTILGFSEESVFYRRFKQWTGLTPKQVRQQHL